MTALRSQPAAPGTIPPDPVPLRGAARTPPAHRMPLFTFSINAGKFPGAGDLPLPSVPFPAN
jgi:hypothetical protein